MQRRSAPSRLRVAPQLGMLMAKIARRRSMHHVALGATAIDGSWTWTDAAGVADPDGEPMRSDTPWLIASVTKLYITAVVLRLVERGGLRLDEPLTNHLPEEFGDELHVHQGVDHTPELTGAHLLGHLSGMPDYLEEKPAEGAALIDEIIAGPDRRWTPEDAVRRARDRLSTHFPPSSPSDSRPRIRYSNTNFQLLVVAAQHTTGTPMHELYRELLFEPLGLQHTWLPGHDPTASTSDPATVWLGSRPFVDRPDALASIGDLYTTTEDLLRFGRALMSGDLFDDAATFEVMRRRFNRFGLPRSLATLSAPGWPIESGLGLMRFQIGRLLAGGRRLPTVIGHTGSTGSWLWYAPNLEVVVAGTVDQSRSAALPFRAVPRALAALDR